MSGDATSRPPALSLGESRARGARAGPARVGSDALSAPRAAADTRLGPPLAGQGALPAAAANLLGFARLLRAASLGGSTEQAVAFLEAVALLGPRSMDDIRKAALATLAPRPDDRTEFEALFRAWFWGEGLAVATGDSDDETRIAESGAARERTVVKERAETGGELASAAERLATRTFRSDDDRLAAFRRALPSMLPQRRSLQHVSAASRGKPDLRRSLRAIVQADGDVPALHLRRRPLVQRRLVLMIDISGSMKQHTADHLKLAHAVVQGASRAEVFTLGTRLTRITPALRVADCGRALARAAETVEDWDGGTRIGPTLLAFLSVPRFAAMAQGAAAVILSDGLERGDPSDMTRALRRLSARAVRLSLATPLAADPRFRPRTAALQAALPLLDDLVDGSSIESLTSFVLSLARPAPSAEDVWRKVS